MRTGMVGLSGPSARYRSSLQPVTARCVGAKLNQSPGRSSSSADPRLDPFRGGRQAVMHAAVGDRIIVASATLGAPARDGEILEVHGTNGEAPYLVRWSDTGRESLFFPGPDVHMQHHEAPQSQAPARPAAEGSDQPSRSASHVENWHIDLYLSEGDESTTAHAVLHGATPTTLDSRGAARHKAGEANVPEIGDEVAVARALRALADRLLATASEDMSAIEGRAVHIEP
jgi:hypothetical protein